MSTHPVLAARPDSARPDSARPDHARAATTREGRGGLTLLSGKPGASTTEMLRALVDTVAEEDRMVLSGLGQGPDRRSMLAAALAKGPRALFIDSADAPIGPRALAVLHRYARSGDRSVVVVSDHPLASLYADHVVELPVAA